MPLLLKSAPSLAAEIVATDDPDGAHLRAERSGVGGGVRAPAQLHLFPLVTDDQHRGFAADPLGLAVHVVIREEISDEQHTDLRESLEQGRRHEARLAFRGQGDKSGALPTWFSEAGEREFSAQHFDVEHQDVSRTFGEALGVLLGGDEQPALRLGVTAGRGELRRSEDVVIRVGVHPDDPGTQRRHRALHQLGTRDAEQQHHGLPLQRRRIARGAADARDGVPGLHVTGQPVATPDVRGALATRSGLPQRPGGEHPAIPHPSVHQHVEVARQPPVLEAVVEDEEVGPLPRRGARQRHPIGADPDRHARAAAGDQARLVSYVGDRGQCGGGERAGLARGAPIAAGQHRHPEAPSHRLVGQVHHHGGLARASHHEVSHGDHLRAFHADRAPQAEIEQQVPRADEEAVPERRRHEQPGQRRRRAVPVHPAVPS